VKPKGFIATEYCSALLEDGLPCGTTLNASTSFRDRLGYHWCPAHKQNGILLNYGEGHRYPSIVFSDNTGMQYAIGNSHDSMLWEVACILGKPKMIEAALMTLGLIETDNVSTPEDEDDHGW